MSDVRVTQSAVEVLVIQDANVRVTQSVVEIIAGPPAPPPSPVPAIIPAAVVGGLPQAVMSRCQHPNVYDNHLQAELHNLRGVRFPRLCAIPEEFRNYLPWDLESAIPEQAVPFRQTGGVLTPTTASGDNTVTSLRVPTGYDGILTGLYWFYNGTGFDQGSGDILWRVQINQRYVKDLSNVPFVLGSPQTPVPLTEGAILYTGQVVKVIVNVPDLSGMIQIGASTISAGLLGFFWPR